MATQAAARAASVDESASAAPLPTVRHAARLILTAAALGLAGQLLFVGVGLGINFPIAIGLLLVGGWRLRLRTPSIRNPDAWLARTAVVFAAFAAVRADPTIVTLDALTALALTGAGLAAYGGLPVSPRPFVSLVRLSLRLVGWAVGGALPALAGAGRQAPPVVRRFGPAASATMPVLRGLLLAIPIALVFVALFAAADAVFADLVGDLFGFDLDLGALYLRALVAALLGWLAAGALALAAADHADAGIVPACGDAIRRIASVEVVPVLGAVTIVFAVFVGLQAAYLFGGLDTLAATGLTYAEYARRGFFELVAVAILAGGLVIGAERLARDRSGLLVAFAAALVLLTLVVLASATLRLRLYQEVYGWTELRLYVLATIALLAVGAVALLAALFRDRVRWMGHALLAAALAIGLVLNVIGPARFITEQNVARALDPSLVPSHGSGGLDIAYAFSLGDDAVPALARAIAATDDGDGRDLLVTVLAGRLDELRREEGLGAWQAWNAGREAAR